MSSNEWRGISSDSVTSTFANGVTEVADGSPSLNQPSATAMKAHVFVQFSHELGQDWTNLQQELAVLIADAKATGEATAFHTGSGVAANPLSLLTGGHARGAVTRWRVCGAT